MSMSEPKTAQLITSAHLDFVSRELTEIAGKIKRIAEVAKREPEGALAVFNLPYLDRALDALHKFIPKAEESRVAAELGRPIKIGQLKPRSTAKNKKSARAKSAGKVVLKSSTKKPG